MARKRPATVETEPLVLDGPDGLERRIRPAGDGVVVEVWTRTAVVRLTADEVAMVYAVAERARDDW
jgi:hypothetical protein